MWLLVIGATLALPLVQVLGYESVLVLNVLVVLLGGPRALGRWMNRPIWERFWLRCADLSVLALLSCLLVTLNALGVRNCDWGSGLGFWWMFGLLSIPPVVALGMLCERFSEAVAGGARVALGCYLVTVLASMCASGLWLAFQPPLVVYDAFSGFWAVSIYDEALRPWYSHWAFRLMTLVGAALWLHLLALEVQPRQTSRWAWLGALTVTLGLLVYYSGPLGIARSRSYTQELLGGTIETEHFVIHYEAAGFSKPDLVLLVADHELRYAELRAFWGIEPSEKLHSYIYASRETRAKAMGSSSTMIARVWLREMHLVWDEFGAEMLGHEMSHLFLRDAGRGPLRLSSADGLFPLMGLVEGAASAAAWKVDELDDHGWAAAILRHGLVSDVEAMIGASSFWSQPSGVAYTLWSSFCRWLIEEQGPATFLDAYRDGNFERAYGRPRSELFEAWTAALMQVELRDAEEAAALMRFERPSLLRRACGRAIASKEYEAGAALMRRDHAAAAQCLEWLERKEPGDLYLQLRVAQAWERLDRPERARRIYEGLLQREQVGAALAQHARLQLADLAWRATNDAEALKWLREMEATPRTDAMERNLWVRKQLIEERAFAPRAYDAGRHFLTQAWNYRGMDLRLELLSATFSEKSLPLIWLAYRMSAGSELTETAETLASTLRGAELPPSVRERFMLDELGRWSRQGQTSKCATYRALETESAPFRNAIAVEATMLRERCEAAGLYLDAARRAVE